MNKKAYQLDDKIRFFQLYLVCFMRAGSAAIEHALEQLNSTEAELKSVKQSMKGLGFEMIGGPKAEFYKNCLGEPVSEMLMDNNTLPDVFHNSKALRFKLPVWPVFDLVVNELPDGTTFDSPSFRRAINAKVPQLNSLSDLEPWKFVKEEVNAHFGSPEVGDAWDYWEDLDYPIPRSPDEPSQKLAVQFDFNLIQSFKCLRTTVARQD